MSSTTITSEHSQESQSSDPNIQDSIEVEVTSETIQPIAQSTTTITIIADSNNITDENSNNSDGPLCRICWLDETPNELIRLPCKCQGTMGFVHAVCLKEWERIRQSRRCEICKETYLEQRDFVSILRSFLQYQYAGIFFCKVCNIAATAAIAYCNIVLGEMNIAYLISSEKASPSRYGSSYPVMILSAAIFPYFVINYLAVDFAMSEMIDCYRVIRDWWYNET